MSEIASAEATGHPAIPSRDRSEPSDRRLLRAARGGSPEAVEALIERHWSQAHRIAYGILGDAHAAEDVTQEAMLSVLGSIGRFDPYQPFHPWLHRIVSNRALDWARARARRAEVPIDPPRADDSGGFSEDEPALEVVPPSEGPAQSVGLDPALEGALAALSPDHRAVIVLRFVAGYGPKETGRVLGIPTGTVGSRMRRALDQLRIDLEVENG
jgi:RNA polymerase sigma-70 factor (ECF subfamily)